MKKDLSDIILFLKVHLSWYDFSNSRFAIIKTIFQYFRLISTIVLWFVSLIGVYFEGFSSNFDGKYFFTAVLLLCWFQTLNAWFNRKLAARIINKFQTLLKKQNENCQMEIFKKDVDYMWKAIRAYQMILFFFAILYFILPFFIDIGLSIFWPETKFFKTPFCLDGFLIGGTRNMRYYLVSLISIMWPVENMVTHIGCVGVLSIFITYLGCQIKILIVKVETFSTIVLKSDTIHKSTISIEEMEAFKGIVRHHVVIIGLTKDLKQYFGLSYAGQYVIAAVCQCITMVASLNLFEKQAYFLVATNVMVIYIMVVLVFGTCFMGEYLQTQNLNLYRALCSIPWYALHPKIIKDVNFIVTHAAIHRGIDFHGLAALNLHTFMQVMNTSYSYFMVLKSIL